MKNSTVKRFLNLLLVSFVILIPAIGFGQGEVEMADGMRADGKIYVVVGVILILFIFLFGYMVKIDRKISALENED